MINDAGGVKVKQVNVYHPKTMCSMSQELCDLFRSPHGLSTSTLSILSGQYKGGWYHSNLPWLFFMQKTYIHALYGLSVNYSSVSLHNERTY